MIALRPAANRGRTQLDWLDSWHSFSFGDYVDPAHRGFRSLRVINDDRVAPGAGFDTHPHRDMEIITWVLSGALAHRDSLGNGSTIVPGDVQRMTAGTGILHSEFNPSPSEPLHLLQIWLLPERKALPPSYEQRSFPSAAKRGRLRLVASRDGREGSVMVHQDAALYAAELAAGESVTHALDAGRFAWLQVARGGLVLNGGPLAAGDGAAISGETRLAIAAQADSEFLLFDLA